MATRKRWEEQKWSKNWTRNAANTTFKALNEQLLFLICCVVVCGLKRENEEMMQAASESNMIHVTTYTDRKKGRKKERTSQRHCGSINKGVFSLCTKTWQKKGIKTAVAVQLWPTLYCPMQQHKTKGAFIQFLIRQSQVVESQFTRWIRQWQQGKKTSFLFSLSSFVHWEEGEELQGLSLPRCQVPFERIAPTKAMLSHWY